MAKVFINDAYDTDTAVREALAVLVPSAGIRSGDRVFLKPNLTYPTHRPGVTTSPRFLRSVIRCFAERGALITVGEGDGGYGSWSADVAFDGHGLRDLCREFGAELVNLSSMPSRVVELFVRDRPYHIALPIVLLDETDAFITLPVPKIHAMTLYSGAVKNQWGCIPDHMRLRRHPDFTELVWALNEQFKPKLVLGDAQYILDRNGPMVGDAIYMNRVIASDNVLAFDVTVAKDIMGLDPEQISYFEHGRGLGQPWGTTEIEDRSTGPVHQFVLKRGLRYRVTGAAFSRQWAVDLLWFSKFGDLAHRILYAITGNPVARERERVEQLVRARTQVDFPE